MVNKSNKIFSSLQGISILSSEYPHGCNHYHSKQESIMHANCYYILEHIKALLCFDVTLSWCELSIYLLAPTKQATTLGLATGSFDGGRPELDLGSGSSEDHAAVLTEMNSAFPPIPQPYDRTAILVTDLIMVGIGGPGKIDRTQTHLHKTVTPPPPQGGGWTCTTHYRSQEWVSLNTRTCPSLALQLPVTLTPFSLLILCVCNLQQKLGKYIQLKINVQGHRSGMRTLMIKQH